MELSVLIPTQTGIKWLYCNNKDVIMAWLYSAYHIGFQYITVECYNVLYSVSDVIVNVHDDVIKWKYFQRYWPFIRGIHRSPPVTRRFDVSVDVHLNKRLSKQSRCWWFETLWRSLWRHCNENVGQTRRGGMNWGHGLVITSKQKTWM